MREEYRDREISVAAIRPLLERLPAATSRPLMREERISWASFSELIDAYAIQEDADPKALGVAAVASEAYQYRRRIRLAGKLLLLEDLLRFVLYPRNPIDFSCINTAISSSDGRVDVVAHINRRYEPNPNFWEMMLGAGEELLRTLGWQDTRLEMSVFPHEAHFAFKFVPREDIAGKFHRWCSRAINGVALRAIVLRSYPDLVAGRKMYEDEAIERARIASELAAAQRAFESRLAHLDEVVAEFDPAGRLTYVSPNLKRLIGLSEAAPAEAFFGLIHTQDQSRVRAAIEATLRGEQQTKTINEFRVVDPSGGTRWAEIEFTRYTSPEGLEHTIAIGRDITERRKHAEDRRELDRHLEQTQRLEMLGVLAGGVAHDFNNLLVPILGQAELAAAELDPSSELHKRVDTICTAAEKASDLVHQLILYAGGQPSSFTRVDLAEETREMLKLASATFAPGIEVRTELGQGAMVNADAAQLRQIIMNLLINASEAIGDASGLIEVRVEHEPGNAVLVVADDGCGMDEVTQRRVFEPFYTTKFTGRGLGLSAVLGIVRAHQGELVLHSEPGEGSRFELHLPEAAPLDAEITVELPEPDDVRFDGVVLLVDDEAGARDTGRDLLEQQGFRVEVRSDGAEALEFLQESHCDFAVVDLVMPKVDGREVLATIRRDQPELPVIIVSGYGAWTMATEFKSDPHTRFLPKPYRAADLARTLRELQGMPEAVSAATP